MILTPHFSSQVGSVESNSNSHSMYETFSSAVSSRFVREIGAGRIASSSPSSSVHGRTIQLDRSKPDKPDELATVSAGKSMQSRKDVSCPHHDSIPEAPAMTRRQGWGQTPMDRFLAEGPTEQSALFNRPDTGRLSTSRGCTCYDGMNYAIVMLSPFRK